MFGMQSESVCVCLSECVMSAAGVGMTLGNEGAMYIKNLLHPPKTVLSISNMNFTRGACFQWSQSGHKVVI